jgi:hypothetical protein
MFKEVKTNAPTAKNGGRKVKNDIIFVAVLLAIVLLAGLVVLFARGEGDMVEVTVGGKIFGEYYLNADRQVEIRVGDNYNILVIENGEAYVESASCPDGICSDHRPISKNGESIACLPNKVAVTVKTAETENEPDIVA